MSVEAVSDQLGSSGQAVRLNGRFIRFGAGNRSSETSTMTIKMASAKSVVYQQERAQSVVPLV